MHCGSAGWPRYSTPIRLSHFFNGTSTSTSSIATGHDVLGIPGYLVDPKTKARRQQIPSVAQFRVTNQLGIFYVLLQSCTGTAESRLPSCSILPLTSTISMHPSYLSEPSGSPIYFWKCNCNRDRRLTVGGFSGPLGGGLCENKATNKAFVCTY